LDETGIVTRSRLFMTNKTKTSSNKVKLQNTGFAVVGEAAARKELTVAYTIPVNIMEYKALSALAPTDGDGSTTEEKDINTRKSLISDNKWHDFGVIKTMPNFKSVRTGVAGDSRYFEIVNDLGHYAQCTVINSRHNEGGTYANQRLLADLQGAYKAAEDTDGSLLIKTTTRDPKKWRASGERDDFMWFFAVQALII